MENKKQDRPPQTENEARAPRGAYAVLGVVVWGAGALVVLIDLMKPFGNDLSLSWLWIALFSLGALLMVVEFFRHWRRTLKPMSAALLIVGGVIAAIDLGGLSIRRTFFACVWAPLLGLAAVGYLLWRLLEKRHPSRTARRRPSKPLIDSMDDDPQKTHPPGPPHDSR